MNVATIITITTIVISTIVVGATLWVSAKTLDRAEINHNQQIALAAGRINAMSRYISGLNDVIDTAAAQRIEHERAIEYLTLQIYILQGQLERERNAAIN